MIWPRSAILHSAAASRVDGIFAVTVSTAERIATSARRCPGHAPGRWRSGTMSRLSSSVGEMLIAASVMSSGLRIARHIDDEDVADAPRGAQAAALSTTACISSSVWRRPSSAPRLCRRGPGRPLVAAAAWLCSRRNDLESPDRARPAPRRRGSCAPARPAPG